MKHYKNQPIEEGALGNLGKAALIAAATTAHDYTPKPHEATELTSIRQTPEYAQKLKEANDLAAQRAHEATQQKKIGRLAEITRKIFRHVTPENAHHYASLAVKYAHPVFPKAEDLMASMAQESTMSHTALSKKGAYGLMQVVPSSWRISYSAIDTPEKQVSYGAKIMRDYHKMFKNDTNLTIQAYNMGPGRINRGEKNEDYAAKHEFYKKQYMEGIEND